jgi:hypothetical protein
MGNNILKIVFDNTIQIEMKNALVSGRLDDFAKSPTSLYSGLLDLEEIHEAAFYAHRAVLKLLLDEFDFSLDDAESFLLSAVSEAVTKEYNVRVSGISDADVTKVVKDYRNSQN